MSHFRKSQCSEMAPIFTQRYEKKYGIDENVGIPRCMMAVKFSSQTDPTGENVGTLDCTRPDPGPTSSL
jgi:hypothetical protein